MRILLVSDIHGNWPALQAIQEEYDVCLFLGDLVDYGLQPAPCIQWVRENATYSVRGNHDHGVAQYVHVQGRNGFRYLTGITRQLTQERISEEDRRFLGLLPTSLTVTLDHVAYLMVHATPRDPLDEYAIADKNFWERRLQDVEASVICVGHTHHPYVLEVGDKLVINPGSVGQPRDGDPRAAYAIIDNHRVELKRAEYPVQSTISVIRQSTLPEQAKVFLAEVFTTGGMAKSDAFRGRSEQRRPETHADGSSLADTHAQESENSPHELPPQDLADGAESQQASQDAEGLISSSSDSALQANESVELGQQAIQPDSDISLSTASGTGSSTGSSTDGTEEVPGEPDPSNVVPSEDSPVEESIAADSETGATEEEGDQVLDFPLDLPPVEDDQPKTEPRADA